MADTELKKGKPDPKTTKKFLTLFITIVPSLVIAMSSAITELFVRLSIQVVMLLLQIVVIKSLLEDYYKI